MGFSTAAMADSAFSVSSGALRAGAMKIGFSFSPGGSRVNVRSAAAAVTSGRTMTIRGPTFSIGSKLGARTFSLRVAYPATSTGVCCALSKARPSRTDALCSTGVGVRRAAAIGTVTVGNRSGSGVVATACAFPRSIRGVTTFVRGTSGAGDVVVGGPMCIAFRGNSGLCMRSRSNTVMVCNDNLPGFDGKSELAIVNGCSLCGSLRRVVGTAVVRRRTNSSVRPALARVTSVAIRTRDHFIGVTPTAVARSTGFRASDTVGTGVAGKASAMIVHGGCGGFRTSFTGSSRVRMVNVIAVCGKRTRVCTVSITPCGRGRNNGTISGLLDASTICMDGNALFVRAIRNTSIGMFSVGNHALGTRATARDLATVRGLPRNIIVMAISNGVNGTIVHWLRVTLACGG